MSRLCLWVVLWVPTVAAAAPANVFFVLDTSASMAAPGLGEGTQLDDAKAIVATLAADVEAAGHRSALLRFRQRDVVTPSGEGPRTVTVEDPRQCDVASDVLVPLEGGAAPAITRWVDGEAGQGLFEVEAIGDSPLYGSARVALRYVDGLRALDPRRHCVRALIVIVTDGEDNCAGGAELLEVVDELSQAAPEQAIQTLVIARQVDAEAALRLAAVGREEADPHVFGFGELDAVRERIAVLEGAAAIPGCGAADMEPMSPSADAGTDGGTGERCETVSGGCSAGFAAGNSGGGGSGAAGWWLLLMVVVLWRRKLLFANVLAGALLALSGCGDDEVRCVAEDAGVADAPGDVSIEIPDPAIGEARLRERQAAARAAMENALTEVDALVRPEAVFASLADADECRALVDAVAYEPYQGFQRGVRGCLATRRCNSADQTLLLQACLAHHGVETELRACRFDDALTDAREALEAQEPRFPDVAPIDEALRREAQMLLDDLPEVREAATQGVESVAAYARQVLRTRVAEDVARLRTLTENDSAASMALAEAERERSRGEHYFLLDGDARIDALLDAPTDCFDAPVDVEDALRVRVELLVQNVSLSGRFFAYEAPVSIGAIERPVHAQVGEPLEVVVTDAQATEAPGGLPMPAEGDAPCFRAFLDGEPTAAFPLFAGDVSACGSEPPDALREEHGFGRLILRTVVEDPSGRLPHTRDRILVDRFGYARNSADAVANGPTFGALAAGHLIPMRVEFEVGGGMPGPHEEMRALLSDRLARFDEFAAGALSRIGAATSSEARAVPAFGALTFALARDALDEVMADGAFEGEIAVRGARPWRLATVWRRIFVAGEGITERRIFDLMELPFVVHAADAEDRLDASLRLGALFTEAERLAGMSLEGALRVVHAGDLLRDETQVFEAYDAPLALERYPFGLRDAARERTRAGDELFVVPAPVDVFGTEILSWWRVDPLGVPIGEIRYEGSLYGGVTAAKGVATFVRCLGFQAIVALTGPRVAPDVSCCADLAFRAVVADLVVGWIMTGVTGGIGIAMGATYGDAVEDVVDAVTDGVTTAGDVDGLLDLWRDPPPCVRIISP